jgi:ribosome-associated toxin RatA of RatAB toxin-antitoxin module
MPVAKTESWEISEVFAARSNGRVVLLATLPKPLVRGIIRFKLQKVRQTLIVGVARNLTVTLDSMHKTNSIVMRTAKTSVFETAANLELWPKILPHYRYIRYLERGLNRNVVVMAARRSGIPISWTSEQIIDRQRFEVRFNHLKALTKGMHVVWTFEETPEGIRVSITHDLQFRVKAIAPLADKIIGDFFIHNIANKTLHSMKAYVEARAAKGTP